MVLARRACELIAWTDRLTAPLRSLEELATAEETAREQEVARAQGDGEAELTKAAKIEKPGEKLDPALLTKTELLDK